jgi:hypothetical protein
MDSCKRRLQFPESDYEAADREVRHGMGGGIAAPE